MRSDGRQHASSNHPEYYRPIKCLGHLLRNERAALVGDAEAIRQMRVAVRRLRSVRWLAGSLRAARDWEVFVMDLLAPVQSILHTGPDLGSLVEAAKQRQQAAYEAARKAIESRRYFESMLKMVRWFETCGWRDQRVSEHSAPLFSSIIDIAPLFIERRWRQAIKRCRHFARLSLAERHQFRIALKNMRYVIEFCESLFDATPVRALTKRLKVLQEDLGHLNDVRTAQGLIKELTRPDRHDIYAVGLAAGVIIGWHLR